MAEINVSEEEKVLTDVMNVPEVEPAPLTQHNTTQHKTIQNNALYNMLSW